MVIPVIIGIVALSVILLVHELGHFISGKAVRARVEEFGIGFPPRLFGVRRGETLYSLNAIPFGAFNKFTGEEDPKLPRSLASKGIGTRLLVLSAGSLMNFLLALLLFSITFMIPHDIVTEPVVVEEVAPNSPAAMAGIEPGDRIISINEKPVQNIVTLQRYISLNLGKETTILVQHSDATTENIQVIPRWKPPEGQGAIGIKMDIDVALSNRTIVRQSYPFWRAIPLGAGTFTDYLLSYKDGLVSTFTGKVSATFVGPVGLAQLTGEVAKAGIRPLLEIAGLLSLILGICNLFPIPALDGGRIVFIFLEWVRRGKRISAKTEGRVHLIGFAMLIAFLLAVTYQDIIRIISGGSLIP